MLTGVLPPRAVAAAPALADILKAHNVQPLQPSPQAPDFSLPQLDGKPLSLTAFHGHWVLLTFFATWCGPCAAEMPSLQGLYDSMSDKGLDVVAVAVDPEDDVAGYVRKRNLRFPVLLDTQGRAASTYQASSIPITYLMDPSGKLVGVAQGARDWQAASTLIDALMRATPPTVGGKPAAIAAPDDIAPAPEPVPAPSAPVPLPSTLVPPEARVEVEEARVEARKPFHVDVTVQWAGSLRDYILLPPSVALPHHVRDLGTAATTSSDAGRATIVYRLTLVSDTVQTIKLDPVEVRYQPAGQGEPLSRHVAGPTVDVQPVQLLGMNQIQMVVACVVVSLLMGVGVLLLVMRKLRRDKARARDAAPKTDAGHATLEDARRARIDGDVTAFMACMATLLPEPPELRAEVATLAEAVQYGGERPDGTTLDRLLRAAERRVERLASAPEI